MNELHEQQDAQLDPRKTWIAPTIEDVSINRTSIIKNPNTVENTATYVKNGS